jgi:hypothetical protein
MPKRARTSLLLVIGLLAAVLSPLASPAGALVLDPPTGLFPDGQTYGSAPSLTWNPVAGADGYRVRYSLDPGFGTGVITVTKTHQTTYVPPQVLATGTWYWQVASFQGSDLGPYATAASFTIGLAGPTPTAPPNGTVVEFPTEPAAFSWSDVPGAKEYEFEYDDESEFVSPSKIKSDTNGAILVGTPPFDQLTWWRVRALFSGGATSDWSEPQSFTVTWPNVNGKGKPVLQTPPNTAPLTQVTDVEFSWAPVLGVKDYQIAISRTSDFSNLVEQRYVENNRYTPLETYDNGSYWWRVRPRNEDNQLGPWSDISAFTRAWPANPAQGLPGVGNPPTIVGPADGAVIDDPMQLDWEPVDRAGIYQVQFGNSASWANSTSNICRTVQTHLSANDVDGHPGTASPGACSGLGATTGNVPSDIDGVTYWRVRAVDTPTGVVGLWSETRSFTRVPYGGATDDPLTQPVQTGPADCDPGECTPWPSVPTMTWQNVPGAAFYYVHVAVDENFTTLVGRYRVPNSATPMLQPREEWRDNNAGQAYYWHVQACKTTSVCTLDPQGQADPPRRAFQKNSTPAVQNGPGIAYDVENPPSENTLPVVTEMPRFSWRHYLATSASNLDARAYRIEVATDPQFNSVIDNKVTDLPFYAPYERTYREGPLYWRVTAIDGSNNPLTTSGGFAFNFATAPPALVKPAANASLTSVPQFEWQLLPHTRTYRFELYEKGDQPLATGNRIDNRETVFNGITPFDSLAPGVYAWRVRGDDAEGKDKPWSEVRKFTIAGYAPDLLSPFDGQVFDDGNIAFTWEMDGGNPTDYRVEWSKSATFSTGVSSQITHQTSWVPTTDPSEGTWYWRVHARNGDGEIMGTSETRTFVRQNLDLPDAPSNLRITPTSGALGITWRNPSDAASYTGLELTLQPGNMVIPLGKTTTSRTVNGLINGQTYLVSLVAKSADGPGPAATGSGTPNGCAGTPFKDVAASHPFCTEISWMYSEGLSTGTVNAIDQSVLYKPTDPVSRQAMSAFLHRYDGDVPATLPSPYFADVGTSHAFYDDIQWMAQEGLSLGTPNPPGKPLYKPTSAVSRQAMSAFLHRYDGDVPATLTAPFFADVGTSHAFYDDIQWMAQTGLSTGTANPPGKPLYKPVDPVSRMAMAAFLYRYDLTADD